MPRAKNPNLSGLKPFKKGQSGNPGGRPKMPDDLKRVKMLHRTEFQKRISRILGMTKAQRTKFKNAPKTETIDLIIVSLVERATTAGCTTRLNFLIEQLLGKLPEKFEHSSPDGTMPQVQVYVPENGRAKKDE